MNLKMLLMSLVLAFTPLLHTTESSLEIKPKKPPHEKPAVTQYASKVPILTYHHILPDKINTKFQDNDAVLSLDVFKEQMEYLYENDFTTLTIQELDDYVHGKIKVPEKSIVITFDDGYLSNYKFAYPILKEYGFRATIFSVTGNMKEKPETFDPDKLNLISWEEAKKYADVFDIQSHTNDFHRKINGKAYLVAKKKSEIIEDLSKSRNLTKGNYFAYPYGEYNQKTIDALKETGFTMAFTTKRKYVVNHLPPYEIPRFSIYRDITFEQFKSIVNGNGDKSKVAS